MSDDTNQSEDNQNLSGKSITFPYNPNPSPKDDFTVRVLTLNCWGLWLGAKKRRQRMAGIVGYLRRTNCDIVFLQEVWVTSDFEAIRNGTNDIYRFAHLFRSGSVLGSSGIVILCKWLPRVIHFEPYSLNGSPFYPWHGDWFAGKGIAYSRVDFEDLSLHLFSTHTHAYYKEEEHVHDQYSVHRVCQAYQLARFINFINDTSCNRRGNGKDLIIVAGDMNTTSSQLPYKILTTMAGLTDCFKTSRFSSNSNIIHKHKLMTYRQKLGYADNNSSSGSSNNSRADSTGHSKPSDNFSLDSLNAQVFFDSDTEDDDITYCHPRNSFTPSVGQQYRYKAFKFTNKQAKVESTNKLKGSKGQRSPMKRIDFILCRLLTQDSHCVVDRITEDASDPSLDCSLSDHEPVMVELKIHDAVQTEETICNGCDSNLEETTCNEWDSNLVVMEKTQDILTQYYDYRRKYKIKLLYLALLMFISGLLTTSYYILANELLPISTVIFMWLASWLILTSSILIGYLSYKFEQGAIEATLNDIRCKITLR